MKLELKKIAYSAALSDDSNAFTADVFIDGVKRATARNQGNGGPTDLHAYAKPRQSPQGDEAYFKEKKGNQVFIDQYEAWAAQQPEIETNLPTEGGGKFTYPHTLEADVDLLLEEYLKAQFAKKDAARLQRMCQQNWVFSLKVDAEGQPHDANTIFTIPRRETHTLEALKKHLTEKHGANLKEFLNETIR